MNSSENKSPESNLEKRLKRQVIGKPHRFIAVVPLGFEETLVEELKYIGVECVQDCTANGNCAAGIKVAGDGKVEFTAKITEAWKAVAYSRIANRVLMEIATFKAENFGQLEKGVAAVPWELYLGETGVVIHVTCRHSRLYHSDAVEERIRKNITPTDHASAPQHLYVNLQDDRCTLWLDLAGEELYKRGHERFVAEAPLKETIAAAMIFEAIKLQTPEFLTTNHQPLT
ncbi:MAG: THUMP domain-containing protein, partial [Fibrobacter sp.]|nr:THUMP domain-containing protein [Fibrobacter sp.]